MRVKPYIYEAIFCPNGNHAKLLVVRAFVTGIHRVIYNVGKAFAIFLIDTLSQDCIWIHHCHLVITQSQTQAVHFKYHDSNVLLLLFQQSSKYMFGLITDHDNGFKPSDLHLYYE